MPCKNIANFINLEIPVGKCKLQTISKVNEYAYSDKLLIKRHEPL